MAAKDKRKDELRPDGDRPAKPKTDSELLQELHEQIDEAEVELLSEEAKANDKESESC